MPAAPTTAIGTPRATGTALTRTFGRRPDEVPAARQFVRETLGDHACCLDAELLASELVTNAVQHAEDATAITVTVLRAGEFVHVDVHDDGRSNLPNWRETTGEAENGRGFQLVNEIACRWGFLREAAGTCVWFEIGP